MRILYNPNETEGAGAGDAGAEHEVHKGHSFNTQEPVESADADPEPLVEELPVEELPVEEPLVEEPLVEEPLVEELPVEEPLAEEPLVEEPLVEGVVKEVVVEPVVEPVVKELALGGSLSDEEVMNTDYLKSVLAENDIALADDACLSSLGEALVYLREQTDLSNVDGLLSNNYPMRKYNRLSGCGIDADVLNLFLK